nr:hypothetical protein [Candidatus Tectomicrobia bacterium]
MTGDDVPTVFGKRLPQDEMHRLCQPSEVVRHQRRPNRGMLVRAMVMSVGTPGGAYRANVLRSFLEFEVRRVTRAACYRWSDEALGRFMEALAHPSPWPVRGSSRSICQARSAGWRT